jgi:hypothetical protein
VAVQVRKRIGVVGARTPVGALVALALGDDVVLEPDEHAIPGLDALVAVSPSLPVLDAAVAAGVPYVDASDDPAWVSEVLRRHADAAAPVVPACGFDGMLGDLAAAVAAEHFGGPVDDLAVHHDRDVGRTLSLGKPRRVAFPNGARWVSDAELVEGVLVPRHVPGANVMTTLAVVQGVASRVLGRRRDTFQVVAEATGLGLRSFVVCHGSGVEALSARFLSLAARHAVEPGAMAPAEAFHAEPFLDAASGEHLAWSFEFPEADLRS